MTILSSLRSRIFLAGALLTIFSIGTAILVVSARVTREAEVSLRRDIEKTATLVQQLRTTQLKNFTVMARLIADLPKLKAAVGTDDPPTVQGIAADYQAQLKSNLLLITNASGTVLATVGATPRGGLIAARQPAVRDAEAGRESVSLLPQPDGIMQVVTVPISIGVSRPEILGTLTVGFLLDDALAGQLKEATGSDVAFGMDGQILAATLPRDEHPALSSLLRTSGVSRVTIGAQEYVALPRPLAGARDTAPSGAGPVALILRSRTEQLRAVQAIHRMLAAAGVLAVLLATGLSFAVARTITRPLAAITDVMRQVAATGDLTKKIALHAGRRWDDEDARLLAATFNTLTESIARFQREMAQKERLSSLGRLSTVLAHEVRNPLMIIKAALRTLREPDAAPATVREAVADIDEEVARLNHIVNDVLDFARPIRFELAPADLNALCRDAAAAAEAGAPGPPVRLDLDGSLPPAIVTDAERLRMALVNLLANARAAVATSSRGDGEGAAGAPVTLVTRLDGGRATVTITDRGVGIDPVDLPHVFDPFFTTKRGGTGLGLPITRNIVEGLGGAIAVTSAPGTGTEIHLELPIR